MKKEVAAMVIMVAVFFVLSLIGLSGRMDAAEKSGEALFKEFCVMCHPDGGNIVNPKKTLHKKDREANNIKTEADIIRNMRNPGPGMTPFDAKTIPDRDAKEIAKYILKTFNK